ncbi:hypothetical protein [Volucribacter amazonae]|uniref:Uncharacterized protein n=1 Tax=Volucribacter amazonae TaxID=256731 RepID=A0A9X4PHQ2_9PAST|nr:hypothetical protein [Volucribacter amazonae]MDG6895405.1 hypothetical protein [Volucribacter amazonae]
MNELIIFLIAYSKHFLVYIILPGLITKFLFKFTFLKRYLSTNLADTLQAIIFGIMMLVMYFLERKIEIL